jgi:tetratricopeptide (TPR) repeat protein
MKMKEQRIKMPSREELELYMQHKLGKERAEEIDKLMETTPLLRESVEGYLQFPYVSVLVSPASDLIGSQSGSLNGMDGSPNGGSVKGFAAKGGTSAVLQASRWTLGVIAAAGVAYGVWTYANHSEKSEGQKSNESIQKEKSGVEQSTATPVERSDNKQGNLQEGIGQEEQAPGAVSVDMPVNTASDFVEKTTEQSPQLSENAFPVQSAVKSGNNQNEGESFEAREIDELSYNMVLVREYNNSDRPIADLVKTYNRGIEDETRVMFISNFKIVDYTSFRKEAWPNAVLGGVPAAYEKAGQAARDSEGTTGYLRFIENGIYALVKQEYASSYQQFQQLLKEYPDDVNGLFYSGLVKYYLGEYATARAFFEKVQTSRFKTFNEESEFYSALSLWESGNKELASEELAAITARRGFYAKRALGILRSKE